MVHITLNDTDVALLREFLEGQLLELRRERWHTDARAFRQLLKEREEALTRLVNQLSAVAA